MQSISIALSALI